MTSRPRVLVAMSGGIDSSVTAMLLHEQGYEVVGITMKTWDYASGGTSKKETGCCSLDSINDARQVAVSRGFPHYILDIRNEFGDYVIDDFVNEYMAGRTPNPCVLCNTHIKWEALIRRADMLGCEFIATGHYAKVRSENGRYIISRGKDLSKDQSYVLWGLSQEVLKRTLFPLSDFKKSEIRSLAVKYGFEELAKKSESYEICFVPDNDYRSFLKHRIPGLEEKVDGGNFVTTTGKVIGRHRGYPFYTIGQRKGLEIALGEPMFVKEIIPETNTVILGKEDELNRSEMWVHKTNFIKHERLLPGTKALTKIRYKDHGTSSTLREFDNMIHVQFHDSVKGIAPGQSAVFYDGDDVIGGGIIHK